MFVLNFVCFYRGHVWVLQLYRWLSSSWYWPYFCDSWGPWFLAFNTNTCDTFTASTFMSMLFLYTNYNPFHMNVIKCNLSWSICTWNRHDPPAYGQCNHRGTLGAIVPFHDFLCLQPVTFVYLAFVNGGAPLHGVLGEVPLECFQLIWNQALQQQREYGLYWWFLKQQRKKRMWLGKRSLA